ncbi:hypothetical protein EJ07DRAFT_103984 [Lizonia empirigonia]|nr:hypothetical protein EJ07DRAFT_103984 [Lizonia empirigonia]
MPLQDLFVPYPVRKKILQSLSAYDTAKLEVALRGLLSCQERKLYLQPLRDLVEDTAEIQALEAYGMRLLLLGNDVSALQQRLKFPQDYICKHGHSQKLKIYLVGLCPAFTKTTGFRDRLLTSSLFGARNAHSVFEDTIQMRLTKAGAKYDDLRTMFIMSLGASYQQSTGFWLRAKTVPDSTIDLKLYVPSFLDRQRGEVCFPYHEAFNLSKYVLRKAWLQSYLPDLLRKWFDGHILSVADPTSLRIVGPHGQLWLRKQINIQAAAVGGVIY